MNTARAMKHGASQDSPVVMGPRLPRGRPAQGKPDVAAAAHMVQRCIHQPTPNTDPSTMASRTVSSQRIMAAGIAGSAAVTKKTTRRQSGIWMPVMTMRGSEPFVASPPVARGGIVGHSGAAHKLRCYVLRDLNDNHRDR